MKWMFIGFAVVMVLFGMCAITVISKYPSSENVSSKRSCNEEECADYGSDFCQDECELNPNFALSKKVSLWIKMKNIIGKGR